MTKQNLVTKKKKNQINKLSSEYFEYIREHSLKHFASIESFLKNPRNDELRHYYHDTADEIKRKIIAHKEMFDSFDAALTYVSDLITFNNEDLRGRRQYVSVFLHYMYYTCDIGQHDKPIKTS